MNKDPNQPSEQSAKKLDDITNVDIKDTAIDFVAINLGLQVDARDCRVVPVVNQQVIPEIGGTISRTPLGISKWIVYITPRVPPKGLKASLMVTVEYSFGVLDITGFH